MRSDSFAVRLSAARRQELFEAIMGGMSLQEAVDKVHAWSVPKRAQAPSRQAVSDWFRQMKARLDMHEWDSGGGGGAGAVDAKSPTGVRPSFAPAEASSFARRATADGTAGDALRASAGDDAAYRAAERTRAGLQRAKDFWLMEGLQPQHVAAFERNELLRRRLDLEERKHEFAMWMAEEKRDRQKSDERIERATEEVAAAREELADAKAKRDAERRKRAEQQTHEMVQMLLIQIERRKFGEDWMPERLPDGRYKIFPDSEPEHLPLFTEITERLQRLKARERAAAEEAAVAAAAGSQELESRSQKAERADGAARNLNLELRESGSSNGAGAAVDAGVKVSSAERADQAAEVNLEITESGKGNRTGGAADKPGDGTMVLDLNAFLASGRMVVTKE